MPNELGSVSFSTVSNPNSTVKQTLSPTLQLTTQRSKNHVDIRKTAPGTVRQQLQAKVQFWLELRATNAAFGHTPVGNEQCTGCHARDQDSDPVHRFLEPRFFEARAELGAESCVSCHRGHKTFEKPPEVDERWPRDGYYQRRWKPSSVSSSAEHLPNTVIRVSEANQIDRELI